MLTAPDDTGTYPSASATERQQLSPMQLRLLDAAAAAFVERGYDATSVDDIAAGVGVTKGAVYYSYRSKVDLFLGVCERGMLMFEEQVAQALEAAGDGPAGHRLRAACLGHAQSIVTDLSYHLTIQQGVEHRRQMPLRERERARMAEVDAMRDTHERFVEALVEEGVSDGSLRPVPARLATRTLIGGVVGLGIWYRPREGQSHEERAELGRQVVDLVLSGVLTD
jgi:AcrR family transcriptional regulator